MPEEDNDYRELDGSNAEASTEQLIEASNMAGGLLAPVLDELLAKFPALTQHQLADAIRLGLSHAIGSRVKDNSRPISERLKTARSWERGKRVFCVSRPAVFIQEVADYHATPENPYASIVMDGNTTNVPLLLLSPDPSSE